MCSSRSRNCRGIELSSRDFKTVAILVTQAKLYCIYLSENCRILEQIEKLSRYQTIEQGLQNCCNIGHSRPKNCRAYRAGTWKLSRYRTIEQGLENCRAYRAYRAGTWKLSSILSISSRDLKTVEVSNYRAGTWKLSQYQSLKRCPMWRGKSSYAITTSVQVVGAWPKNCWAYQANRETVEVSNYRAGTSKLSQYRSLEQSYTVLTHGLHVRALALRHTPLQAT